MLSFFLHPQRALRLPSCLALLLCLGLGGCAVTSAAIDITTTAVSTVAKVGGAVVRGTAKAGKAAYTAVVGEEQPPEDLIKITSSECRVQCGDEWLALECPADRIPICACGSPPTLTCATESNIPRTESAPVAVAPTPAPKTSRPRETTQPSRVDRLRGK